MPAKKGSDAVGVGKVLEHFEITWKIENYYLATFDNNHIINSPVFYVREPRTKWKMSLAPNPTDRKSMYIRLHRLEYNPGPNCVRADWLLTLIAMKGEDEVECHKWDESKKFFKINKLAHVILEKHILERHIFEYMVYPFEDKDTFCIRCQLFVSDENVYDAQFKPVKYTKLQNLINKSKGKEYDIKIGNKGIEIMAHKEVLMSSSGFFKNLIKPDTKYITLYQDLTGFAKIIAYLYSNDLKHVLSKPNSVLYNCIQELQIEKLQLLYLPTLIKLNTAQDVRYDEFEWVIENVSKIKENTNFTSPIFSDNNFETSWQMELEITVVKTNMSMSLLIKSIGAMNILMLVYFEIVALRKYKFFQRRRYIDFLLEGDDVEFKIDKFLETNKADVRKSMTDNKLEIILKMQRLLSPEVSECKNRTIYFSSK